MSFEETMAALLEAKLAPLQSAVRKLTDELDLLRRKLPPVLVKVPEAAVFLGVSEPTVRRQAKSGKLPSKRIGKSLRIDLTALRPPSEAEVLRLAKDFKGS